MEGKILFERFFGGQKDWNDSRTNVVDKQKIAAPKKNSTFADDFFVFLFFGNLKLLNIKTKKI
jgi:hypothetical protein